jgi:prepilin-type processing-associated H-X9-DG protein
VGAFTTRGASTAEFTDGLSNTLAFAEKLVGTPLPGEYVPNRDWLDVSSQGVDQGNMLLPWSAWVEICSSQTTVITDGSDRAGRLWMRRGAIDTSFLVAVPPNSRIPDCGIYYGGGMGVFAARSLHTGGVNAAMADGSVRFVRDGINGSVWRAFGSRRGGEVISSEF